MIPPVLATPENSERLSKNALECLRCGCAQARTGRSVLKQGATAGPYSALADAQKAGAVTINYGMFANTVISFIIVAFSVFLLIRGLNKMKREEEAPPEEPTTKECAHCLSTIPIKATRCGHCTSELSTEPA